MSKVKNEAELVASLKSAQEVRKALKTELSRVNKDWEAVREEIRLGHENAPDEAGFEDRVQSVLKGLPRRNLREQEADLLARKGEIEQLLKTAEANEERAGALLNRARAEAVKADWVRSVQAVVDALGLLDEAAGKAEKHAIELSRLYGLPGRGVLDLVELKAFPIASGRTNTGAIPRVYLERAKAMGCDVSRIGAKR